MILIQASRWRRCVGKGGKRVKHMFVIEKKQDFMVYDSENFNSKNFDSRSSSLESEAGRS